MLKLVSNKNGNEIHQLEISENGFTITPEFEGVADIVNAHANNKMQLLGGLSQLNPEYVWAVTYETPAVKPLTRRQFRLTLVANGFNLNDIDALIAQIPDATQRQFTQIEWQDANTFERHNPSLLLMASMLEISSDQLNQMWAQALAL